MLFQTFFLLNTKEDILKNVGNSFGSHSPSLYGQKVQWDIKLFGYHHSSQIFFCVHQENEMHICLEQHDYTFTRAPPQEGTVRMEI